MRGVKRIVINLLKWETLDNIINSGAYLYSESLGERGTFDLDFLKMSLFSHGDVSALAPFSLIVPEGVRPSRGEVLMGWVGACTRNI